MSRPPRAESRIRFGAFELDPSSGELLKSGVRVRLQEQPLQVLRALLERPGEVVTREELQRLLWPDGTFVDFDDGLATAVRKLRAALGDSATNPRFVETLPKRGYRFLAPVSGPAGGEARRPETSPVSAWRRSALIAACASAATAVIFVWAVPPRRPAEQAVRKFSLEVGEDVHDPVISPDGRYVAFTRYEADGGLWVQALSEEAPRPLPGTEGARRPFWSPDSREVGFAASGRLMRVEVEGGGGPVEIGPVPSARFRGASWNGADDRIYFTQGSLSASGGDPEPEAGLRGKTSFNLVNASHPFALAIPGRRLILVHSQDGLGGSVREGTHLRDFDKREKHWLFSGRSAVYSPTGHIVYQEDTAPPQLRAIAFSLDTLRVSGESFVIASNATSPSVARDGTLVYLSGGGATMRLLRRDRDGRMIGEPSGPLRDARYLDLSPSGRTAAFTALVGDDREVWTFDLESSSRLPNRLTFNDSLEGFMLWSPDGRRILYRFNRDGRTHFALHPVDGGPVEHLEADGIPATWRAVGSTEYLIFHDGEGIVYGEAQADETFAFHRFGANGYYSRLTRDGRHLVCKAQGNDEWRFEVHTFPEGRGPWQVSLPGERTDWLLTSPVRNEIFYNSGGDLVVAEYVTEPVFRVVKRKKLFRLRGREFEIAPDGETFILLEPFEEDRPVLRVTQNWYEEFSGRDGR